MVTMGVRLVNMDAILQLERKERRKVEDRMAGTLASQVKKWRKLVIDSTWFNKRPSPDGLIIGHWHKQGRNLWGLTYGWTDYRGSAARAQWRLSLRQWMYEPRVW